MCIYIYLYICIYIYTYIHMYDNYGSWSHTQKESVSAPGSWHASFSRRFSPWFLVDAVDAFDKGPSGSLDFSVAKSGFSWKKCHMSPSPASKWARLKSTPKFMLFMALELSQFIYPRISPKYLSCVTWNNTSNPLNPPFKRTPGSAWRNS